MSLSPGSRSEDQEKQLLDRIIDDLRNFLHRKSHAQLEIGDIQFLLNKITIIFAEEPVFLNVEAPVNILGSIFGQFYDLVFFLSHQFPPQGKYLFLGNYVDRGKHAIETICLLYALKIRFPDKIYLLRGSHECGHINRINGFYDAVKNQYNILRCDTLAYDLDVKLWKMFNDTFNMMPFTALVNQQFFCCSGGLSPELKHFGQLRSIKRPTDIPDTGLLCDLLWSDPEEPGISGWFESDRGVSYSFGSNITDKFVDQFNVKMVIRGKQVMEDGYQFYGDKLVSIFSSSCYFDELSNRSAMMRIKEDLSYDFVQTITTLLSQ